MRIQGEEEGKGRSGGRREEGVGEGKVDGKGLLKREAAFLFHLRI